jgi:hypothetical protein
MDKPGTICTSVNDKLMVQPLFHVLRTPMLSDSQKGSNMPVCLCVAAFLTVAASAAVGKYELLQYNPVAAEEAVVTVTSARFTVLTSRVSLCCVLPCDSAQICPMGSRCS